MSLFEKQDFSFPARVLDHYFFTLMGRNTPSLKLFPTPSFFEDRFQADLIELCGFNKPTVEDKITI